MIKRGQNHMPCPLFEVELYQFSHHPFKLIILETMTSSLKEKYASESIRGGIHLWFNAVTRQQPCQLNICHSREDCSFPISRSLSYTYFGHVWVKLFRQNITGRSNTFFFNLEAGDQAGVDTDNNCLYSRSVRQCKISHSLWTIVY